MRALIVLAASVLAALQAIRPRGTIVVSNMNDNTASLVDATTGQTVATLPTGAGPHEVAISHDARTALVSNYGVRGSPGSTITVIDIAGARVARVLDLSPYKRPHGMAFFPGDTLAAVTCETNRLVLVVDVRDGRVLDTLPTSGRATHMLGLSVRGDRVITANIADGTISTIDPRNTAGTRTIKVATQPEGIAITPDGTRAWVGSNRDSVVLVVDLTKGQALDTLRGFGLPYRMAVSPNGRVAVVTDPAKAQIRIFDESSRRQRAVIDVPRDSVLPTAEIPGSPSPEGVAISPDSRWAFVTLQGRNRVVTIDLERGATVALAPIGNWSDGVGFSTLLAKKPNQAPSRLGAGHSMPGSTDGTEFAIQVTNEIRAASRRPSHRERVHEGRYETPTGRHRCAAHRRRVLDAVHWSRRRQEVRM